MSIDLLRLAPRGSSHERTAAADSSPRIRRERKFIADLGLGRQDVHYLFQFFTTGVRAEYKDRYVNNVYFDTVASQAGLDNIAGVRSRKKFRLRWYGEQFGEIQRARLEIKLRQGISGTKLRFAIPPFRLGPETDMREILAPIGSEVNETDFSFLVPTAVNRYRRSYFRSMDGKLRITTDSGLSFWRPVVGFSLGHQRATRFDRVIVELKYSPEDERCARDFVAGLPLRLSKSSKYVMGLLHW